MIRRAVKALAAIVLLGGIVNLGGPYSMIAVGAIFGGGLIFVA